MFGRLKAIFSGGGSQRSDVAPNIEMLERGEVPIYEPGLGAVMDMRISLM